MNFTITEQMMDLIAAGTSPGALCDLLEGEVGNPVAISITSETIIGRSKGFDQSFVNEFTSSTRHMSEEEIEQMHLSFNEFLESGEPHMQAWPYLRHKQINCGCLYHGTLMGVLIVPLSNRLALDRDLDSVRSAAKCFGAFLAASGYITNRKATAEMNFLVSLLHGSVDMGFHRKKLSYLEINNLERMRLIFVLPHYLDKSVEQQIAVLCKKAGNWWHAPYRNGYAILADEKCLRNLPRLEKLLETINARACVSDVYTDLTETKKHADADSAVLEFCLAWGIGDRLFYANDYKTVLAVSYSRNHLPDSYFQNNRLDAIRAYDEEHGTSYMKTLRSCLKCNRNYNAMAEELGVHRNTIFYRVNRLKEEFGVDPDDPIRLASVFFSLLAADEIL